MHTVHPFHPDDFPIDEDRKFMPNKVFYLSGAIHFKDTAKIFDVTDRLADEDWRSKRKIMKAAAKVAKDFLDDEGPATYEIASCGNMMRTIKSMTDVSTGDKVCDLNMTFISFDVSTVRFPKESKHCRHQIDLCPIGDIKDGSGAGRDENNRREAFVRHSMAYFWEMRKNPEVPEAKLYVSLNQKRVEVARISPWGFQKDSIMLMDADEVDDVVALSTSVILMNGRGAIDT